jgi:hypothetical protein
MEKSTFRRENLFPGCSTLLYADCVLTPPEPLGFRPVEMATALFHPEHGLRILVMKEEALKRVFARMPQIQEDYPAGHLLKVWAGKLLPALRQARQTVGPASLLDSTQVHDLLKKACPVVLPWRWDRPFALVADKTEEPASTLLNLGARHWPDFVNLTDLVEVL